jgi:hypothetical protein
MVDVADGIDLFSAMTDKFITIIYIYDMVHTALDLNEPVPLANQKGTMFDVTVPLTYTSSRERMRKWLTVVGIVLGRFCLSLHTRLRVAQRPDLDDVFVGLADVFGLGSLMTFLKSKIAYEHEGCPIGLGLSRFPQKKLCMCL